MSTEETAHAGDSALPGGDFRLFVQKLGYQALISKGVLDNPLTQTRQTNVEQAKGVIDDILMLREKTRGNLEAEEESHLGDVITNLERHFSSVSERQAES